MPSNKPETIKKIDLDRDIEEVCKKYNLKFAHLIFDSEHPLIVISDNDQLRKFLSNNMGDE